MQKHASQFNICYIQKMILMKIQTTILTNKGNFIDWMLGGIYQTLYLTQWTFDYKILRFQTVMGDGRRWRQWVLAVGASCGSRLWEPVVGDGCGKRLWEMVLVDRCWRRLLKTVVGDGRGRHSWDTVIADFLNTFSSVHSLRFVCEYIPTLLLGSVLHWLKCRANNVLVGVYKALKI